MSTSTAAYVDDLCFIVFHYYDAYGKYNFVSLHCLFAFL